MLPLITKWIEEPLPYTGAELRSHFIYEKFDLLGNTLIAFTGPCRVELAQMVDLEDVKSKSPIYSENMLHFLAEFFDMDLPRMVLLQRLLIANLYEQLSQRGIQWLERRGDDLYQGKAKLSVSIATLSPVSGLIHTGINISSKNTPVLTKGLEDYKINPKEFAENILQNFKREIESAWKAVCKVKPVF